MERDDVVMQTFSQSHSFGASVHDCSAPGVPVREVLDQKSFTFCFEEDDYEAVRRKMAIHGIRLLPVVDRDLRLIGTVQLMVD